MNQKIRTEIANRLRELTKGEIFCADWDDRRIAWEENELLSWYYWEEIDKFYEILDAATEGTGYYLELENSVEGCLYEC